MRVKHETSDAAAQRDEISEAAVEAELDQLGLNIAAVEEFYLREGRRLSRSQRLVERISASVGQPRFLGPVSYTHLNGWAWRWTSTAATS